MELLNFPLKISLETSNAFFLSLQIMTPLPAANPSALTTTGKLNFFIDFLKSLSFLQIANFAVGILYFLQIYFLNAFEPSS